MAGLVAAARLRELGVPCAAAREGDARSAARCCSRRASSGVTASGMSSAAECPGGDERLQRLVWERLDDALAWLESLGAPVVWEETGNPRTTGKRFDPRGLTEVLAGRVEEIELQSDGRADGPTILCTGGFARLVRARDALHRARRAAAAARRTRGRRATAFGTAVERGAALTAGLRRVLRPQHAGRAVGRDAARLDVAALRTLRADLRRGRDRVLLGRRRVVVGDERRAGDGAPPGRAGVLPARRGGARAARARADRRRDGRARAAEARVPVADLPFEPPAGNGRRDPRRSRRSRTRSAASRRRAARGCVDAATARAVDGALGGGRRRGRRRRRAATRAAWRRRSCSASPAADAAAARTRLLRDALLGALPTG